jgi:hypothetical protein
MSLKPLNIKSKLLEAPKSNPLYSVTIKDAKQKDISLAHPKATRSLIALMDLAAVNGGAACHWGGPSAMTETWTALHGIMFKEKNWFEKFKLLAKVRNPIAHSNKDFVDSNEKFKATEICKELINKIDNWNND